MGDKKVLFIGALCVLAVWLGMWGGITQMFPKLEERGQFGDLFGAVNSLFSGLAFAALISTFVLQQKQMAMQREELAMQREELKLQRDEMVASRGEMANQTRAQEAMFRATVAQLQISASQIKIEALKVSLARSGDTAGRNFINAQIQQHGRKVEEVANELSEFASAKPFA